MGIPDGNRRAVFLDRDGVINRADVRAGRPFAPLRLEDLEILPGVAPALGRLHDAGFRLVVVTNQPEIARGTLGRDVVDAMHASLAAALPLDEFRVCAHDDADGCDCRKPKPGLLQMAARDGGLDLHDSFMIGDRWRDIDAGRRAGCTTIFIDRSYDEPPPPAPDATVASLSDAADWILSHNQHV